jgi:SAM-dependent methyltransferase
MANVYDTLSGEYDAWFERHAREYGLELEAIRSLLPEFGAGLEVGAGTGRFGPQFGILDGVEPSAAMAALAMERGMRVAPGVAEALPGAGCARDLVLMVTVLSFFRSPARALSEACRVLRQGGHLLLAFIDRDSPLGKIYEGKKSDNPFYRDAVFYSAAEVRAMMETAGFFRLALRQTLFPDGAPEIREGSGEGGFVVIRGMKEAECA